MGRLNPKYRYALTCKMCGAKIESWMLSEWDRDKEEYSKHPLMCPDCYDTLVNGNDPIDLMKEVLEIE